MVMAGSALSARVQSNMGIIRAGVNQGLSSSAIQSAIRATGQLGIRRVDLLQGIRYARGIAESGLQIRSVGRDRFPDPMRIEQSKTPMLSNYSYDVRVRALDGRSGKVVNRFVTVRSDRNLTPRMIEDEAQRAIDEAPEENESGQLSEVESLVVVGARRR